MCCSDAESGRWQALRLPWVGEAQSTEALGSEVLDGLLKLSQTKKVQVHAGDWFVREVGTDGAHVVENDKMGNAYDLGAGIEVDNLSEGQKSQVSAVCISCVSMN